MNLYQLNRGTADDDDDNEEKARPQIKEKAMMFTSGGGTFDQILMKLLIIDLLDIFNSMKGCW